MSLSLLMNLPGGIDPATGAVLGTKTVKKVVKKAAKAAAQAVNAAAAAATPAATTESAPVSAAATVAAATEAVALDAVEEEPSALIEFLSSLDPVTTALVVGFVVVVAFLIYRRFFSATGQRGDTFLLLGEMGAGKTCLYYQLKQGIFRDTHTSIQENDATFIAKPMEGQLGPWRYVDLPGHASQRVKLETLKRSSKGLIFVVDGSSPNTFSKAAQFLYTLLVDPVLQARRTPVFIAINHQDRLVEAGADDREEATQAQVEEIADKIEKILDKTRGLQSTMSDLGSDSETRVRTLGREGQAFSFSDSVCPITVGGISAARGQLQPLLHFLQAQ